MDKKRVIDTLNRKFGSVDRYNNIFRSFDFYQDYVIYICEEDQYIPRAIEKMLEKKIIRLEELFLLNNYYLLFSNNVQPKFVTKKILKKYKYKQKIISFMEKEKNAALEPNFEDSFSKKLTKEEFIFDIDKFHNQLLDELQTSDKIDIKFLNYSFYVDGEVVCKFDTNSKESVVLNAIQKLREFGPEILSYDEIAEDNNEEYSKKFSDAMYQACRRIESKLGKYGLSNIIVYDTKSVSVVIK